MLGFDICFCNTHVHNSLTILKAIIMLSYISKRPKNSSLPKAGKAYEAGDEHEA